MYYVYILHCADGRLYTGFAPDLKARIRKHNHGFVFSTKNRRPLGLIHYEAFLKEKDAKQREEFLKGEKGKKELEFMLAEYFRKSPWIKDLEEQGFNQNKPLGAVMCPICGGAKQAPTKSMFTRSGIRTSGFKAICLTCKGKGWLIPIEMEE